MKGILKYLLFVILLITTDAFAVQDTTILNKEKWNELTKDLDYTESVEPKKESDFKIRKPSLPINSQIVKAISIILIVAFILLILYKLKVFELINNYFKKTEKIHNEESVTIIEQLKPSQELFNEALKTSDKKAAVRLLYLSALHSLAERNLLKIKKETTNSSYIRSLSYKPLQNEFRKLVRVHEMTWFGDKELFEEDFKSTIERTQKILSLKFNDEK